MSARPSRRSRKTKTAFQAQKPKRRRALSAENSQSISEHLEREPDLEQARRAALMAHQAVVKLKKMGMPDEMDEPLSRFCVDLGDVWSSQSVLAKQIEAFLKSPDDWSEMGDRVADIQSTMEHMAWHLQSARAPIERVALWAYERGAEE